MPFIDFGDFIVKSTGDQPTPPIAMAGFNALHVQVFCGVINVTGSPTSATVEAIPQIGNDNASWQDIGQTGGTNALILFGSISPLLPAPGVQQATVGPSAPTPPSGGLFYKVTLGAAYARLLFRIVLVGGTAPTGNSTLRVLVNTFNG